LQTYKLRLNANNPKKGTYQQKEYYIIPAVIQTPGVRNDTLWTKEELSKNYLNWANTPIILDHTYDNNGNPTTASEPGILDDLMLGVLFNPSFNEKTGAVGGDFWLSVDSVNSVPSLRERIDNGEPIDVSVGYYPYLTDPTPGVYNGVEYAEVDYGFIPDHIAILFDTPGACSIADGCGLQNNTTKTQQLIEFAKSLTNIGDSKMIRNAKKEDEKKRSELIATILKTNGLSDKLGGKDFKDMTVRGLELFASFAEKLEEQEEKVKDYAGELATQDEKIKKYEKDVVADKDKDKDDSFTKLFGEDVKMEDIVAAVRAYKDAKKVEAENSLAIKTELAKEYKVDAVILDGMTNAAMMAMKKTLKAEAQKGTTFIGSPPQSFSAERKGPGYKPTFGEE